MFAASKTASVSGGPPDGQFNYVTMLLHGDGTNGAQNNTFLDSSSNNFTITRNGNTTQGSFSPYGSNWSNYFDGATDFLTAGTTATDFLCTGSTSGLAATFEAFVFPTAWNGNSGIRNNTIWGKDGTYISVGLYNGYIQFYWYSGSPNTLTSSSAISLNTWSYIAVTVSGSTVTFYINGTSAGSGTMGSGIQTGGVGTSENIGSQRASSPGVSYFSGYISNFKISNIVRSITSTPTTLLTSDANTKLLVCQSNRFVDNSSNSFAVAVGAGTPSVQRFNPFGTSTAYSTSVIGGSGYFDKSGDYLDGPTNSAFAFGTGDFTISAWVYVLNGTSSQIIWTNQTTSSANAPNLVFFILSNNVCIANTNTAHIASSGTIANNSWNYVGVTKSSGTYTFYINGSTSGTTSSIGTDNITENACHIGYGNYGTNYYFGGYIADLRVIKGSAVTPTVPTAPVGTVTNTQLLLNMTNGAIYDNAMMNDLETVGNAQISTSVKKYGTGSLYFDGTGDALRAQNNAKIFLFGTGNFTVECWLYQTATNTYPSVLEIGDHAGTAEGILFIASNGSTITAYNGAATFLGTATAPSLNTWNHIAWVRNNGTFKIYVNGVGNAGVSFTQNLNVAQRITVGSEQNLNANYTYTGYIDDLRVTNGYARYTANFTPPTAALSDTGPY